MIEPTLPRRFLEVCASYSNNTALVDDNRVISYSELKRLVDNVGAFLSERGVNAGDRVGLVVENSVEYVIAFYSIWKVGGIVVALNSDSKPHEILNCLVQCEATCLLISKCPEQLRDELLAESIFIVPLREIDGEDSSDWIGATEFSGFSGWHEARTQSPAQIIFTSGTTGNPKGILLSHGNLFSNTTDIVSYLGLNSSDSILAVLPFHYSYGNSVLHTHIYAGAEIVVRGKVAYPQDIVNCLREHNITGFSGVASTFSLVLSGSDWADDPPPLRYITQAGGAMSAKLTMSLKENCHSDTKIIVMYGQTEASARICWLPPEMLEKKCGSVGIPLDSVSIKIGDSSGKDLGVNCKGGVYVQGPNVMQRYWGNSKATEKVIVDGWLNTGDLGFIDSDGYLFLEGRSNDMIKSGSHRINPMEIEEVISSLTCVRECAVVGISDEVLGHKLCLFVVGNDSKENTLAIKKHCAVMLPSHKVPRMIHWLDEFPKTASGKVKRHELVKLKERK